MKPAIFQSMAEADPTTRTPPAIPPAIKRHYVPRLRQNTYERRTGKLPASAPQPREGWNFCAAETTTRPENRPRQDSGMSC